jgi:uncharacterized protein YqeY
MLQEIVREKMYEAMKNHDKQAKNAYSGLLDQLKKKEIDNRKPLTEAEEIEVVSKIVKQCKESIAMVPAGTREEFVKEREYEIEVYSAFLPKQLSEDEIMEVIKETMAECNIEKLSNQTRGVLMKNLMPKVKGKADGKLVSELINKLIE